MKSSLMASTLLTVGATLYIGAGQASAAERCEADLGRVENSFCLGDRYVIGASEPASFTYSWKLNDGAFDLSSKVCLGGGTVGNRRDMLLALDRSDNIRAVDSSHHKVGADNLSTSKYIIDKLIAEAKADPSKAPKVGVVMFSSTPDCRAFTGPTIDVNREFPCLYVAAASLADPIHADAVQKFLAAAEGKYSQGGTATSSDYTIVGNLILTGEMGLTSPTQAGLILFSDGRTYKGEANDAHAYLKSGNYLAAESEATNLFSASALKKFHMTFALNPVGTPPYDQTNADAFDTMCALNGAPHADCDKAKVTINNPSSWPVNKLDFAKFATSLVGAVGGTSKDVITINAKQDIDTGLEALRVSAESSASIDSVTYTVNGSAPQTATIDGTKISLESLPAGKDLNLELLFKTNGADARVPIKVTTEQVPSEVKDFTDKEMFCKASAEPLKADKKINLKNLQGGSASCGVTSGNSGAINPWLALLGLALPLLLVGGIGSRRLQKNAILLIAGTIGVAANAGSLRAAEASTGLNALQYRPVVDGVGMTEKATNIPPGTYNAGVFMDYANDPVEIGGDKNSRVNSIMDNLVTAHAVANIGIFKNLSLGLHVPYVHRSDEERDVEGDKEAGGQVGRPSDVTASLKINFVKKTGFAIALMPMATIPTGDAELLLGDGEANFGGMFLLSGTNGAFSWAFDVGYLHRQKPLVLEDDRANSIKVHGQYLNYDGVEYRYSPLLSFGGNLQIKVTAGDQVDFTRSNPAEWMAMAKLRPTSGLDIEGGFGTGVGKGYGSPDYRVFAGLTYVPEAPRHVAAATPKKASAKTANKSLAKRR